MNATGGSFSSEHAAVVANLDGRDADTVVRVHGVHEVGVQALHLFIEGFDVDRLLAEAGIGPNYDGADSHDVTLGSLSAPVNVAKTVRFLWFRQISGLTSAPWVLVE